MADFTKVAQTSEVPPNSLKAVSIGDQEIALVNLNGQIFAIGDICPHAHCSLADGEVEDETVMCPCHGSEFNVKTGALIAGPALEGVATFSVQVEGNDILVAV